MGKNNKATDPAPTNKKIKDTNMANTGRKVKSKEKTKVSRSGELSKLSPSLFVVVALINTCLWSEGL